jgi:dephospho-CoA kinase
MLIGLTGGIATGKSTFALMLARQLGALVFDADSCVHKLLSGDEKVRDRIRTAFGSASFSSQGHVDKPYLRNLIYSDPHAKKILEGILHPVVRAAWQSQAEQARFSQRPFIADIPLLFETGAERFFDAVLLVAASIDVQKERIHQRGHNEQLCEQMLASQLPIKEKVRRAEFVVWNDGDLENLNTEALAIRRLLMSHV